MGKKETIVMESLQNFYNGKRVLVTGGAGFIGSHLVEKLIALGARVTVLDNFSAGNLTNLKSVAHIITLLYADIRSPYSCIKATHGQDIVFHSAALTSVPESIKNPSLCYKINVEGTENLLIGCKKNNVKTFIFSSSSAVYGNKPEECIETDFPCPQSPYASSKYEAELLCQKYGTDQKINNAILRYFNVYGERQNPRGAYAAVVTRFKQQLLSGQPLTIFGDGTQTRDFIHVSNVVDANLILGMQSTHNGEIFNIGSGKSVNLFQLIEQLEQELNIAKTDITFLPSRQGDILNSTANCEKYKTAYGHAKQAHI